MPSLFEYHKERLLEVAQQYLKRKDNVDERTAELDRIKTLVSSLSRDIIQETPNFEWHIDLFELNRILGVFKVTLGYEWIPHTTSSNLWIRYLRAVPDLREMTIPRTFKEASFTEECLEVLSKLRNLRKLTITYDPAFNLKLSSHHVCRELGKFNEESLLALLSSCRNVEELIVDDFSADNRHTKFLWTALKSIRHIRKVEVVSDLHFLF